MVLAKSLLAGMLSTVVLVPVVAFLYLKAITHGHEPGLIAVSGGANEAVLLSFTVLLITTALWYFVLR